MDNWSKKAAELLDTLNKASAKCRDAESRNLSASSINRYYRKLFAAEDAYKAHMGGWAL